MKASHLGMLQRSIKVCRSVTIRPRRARKVGKHYFSPPPNKSENKVDFFEAQFSQQKQEHTYCATVALFATLNGPAKHPVDTTVLEKKPWATIITVWCTILLDTPNTNNKVVSIVNQGLILVRVSVYALAAAVYVVELLQRKLF